MNDSFDPEELSDLIDERLEETDAESVRSRLAGKPEALSLLDDLQASRRRMHELPRLAPSPGLAERIMQSVQRESTAWNQTAAVRDRQDAAREPVLVDSATSGRFFSLAGMRAITGVLSIAALVLLSLVVFPRWAGSPIADLATNGTPGANRETKDSFADNLNGKSDSSAENPKPSAIVDSRESARPLRDSDERGARPSGVASDSHPADSAAPQQTGAVANADPRFPNGTHPVEGAHGDRAPGVVPSEPEQESGIADSDSAVPQASGAEFLMVVRLPTMDTPTQDWIDALFRPVEQPAADPEVDGFQSRLSELASSESALPKNSSTTDEAPDSSQAHDRYVVQANADLLRLIIDRMPKATIECSAIERIGLKIESPQALPAPPTMYRKVEPFVEGSETESRSGELPRAERILRFMGVDENPQRQYLILFEFQFRQ